SGKSALARLIAVILMDVPPEKVDSHPYFMHLTKPEDKQEIPIDKIRQTIRATRLKMPEGKHRVIFIEQAESLSTEAQNALLKILEEPPTQTTFILTVPSVDKVLSTITSRVRSLTVHPVNLEISTGHYRKQYPANQVETAWRLSQGSAGLLQALLLQDRDHPLKSAVDEAKKLLGQSTYERLLTFEKIGSDRDQIRLVLEALSLVLTALHRAAVDKGNMPQTKTLSSARRLVTDALGALDSNTSSKLITLNLVLKLPV
ncbi:MAG: hypothetical protein WD887_01070, partial [Candidatus Saccharimonadales bacterium]